MNSGARCVKAGLLLLPIGLVGGLLMSLYAFVPLVQPPAGLVNYDDLPRRLLRLGHIAAIMLPLITIVTGLVLDRLWLPDRAKNWAGALLIIGAATLPAALAVEGCVAGARELHLAALPAITFVTGACVAGIGALRTPAGGLAHDRLR